MRLLSGKGVRQRVPLLLSMLIISAGLWVAQKSGEATDLRMRRELARQARSITAAISPDDIRALSFNAEDTTRPQFQRLCSQMRAYAEAVGIRSLYTMALRAGNLVFGPESLLPGDPYASPPGTVYQKPTPKDFEVFKTGEATIDGPYSDEYGEFVTALIPVIDPRTGTVLATIGVDVEAQAWRKEIRKAQWIPFLTALIPVSILLPGLFILKIRQRLAPQQYEYLRHTEAVICATIMLLLTLITSLLIHVADKKSRETIFHTQAQVKSAVYTDAFRDLGSSIDMLVHFFESSESITRREFASYCTPFLQHNSVQACVWLPEISGGDAERFAAQVSNKDLPGFSIWQISPSGERIPAQGDPLYPVLYVEPESGHEKALGYNLYSEPLRRAAIEEALQTKRATATDPVSLIALPGEPEGFFIFKPVSSQQQKGIAGFAVRPDMLFEDQMLSSAGDTTGLSVGLFQLHSDGEPPHWLACSRKICNQNCWQDLRNGLHTTIPVFAFGKTYTLLITPEQKWLTLHPLRGGQTALTIGLVLTLLLTSLIDILATRPYKLEQLVQQRTAELQTYKNRVEQILNAVQEGWWENDLRTGECHYSATMFTMLGYPPPDGREAYDFFGSIVHPDDMAILAPVFQEMAKNTAPYYQEFRMKAADGSWHYISSRGNCVEADERGSRYVGTHTDITGQRMLQTNLRRLSAAIEQSPEAVVITDPDGIIQYVNPAFERITGYSLSEALGQNPRILKSGRQDKAFYSHLWETITSGKIWEGRVVNKRKDGIFYTEEASISPVRDPSGAITGYVAVKRDVTEELVKEEQFRQSQKMEAVGQLAGGIAHDFNNILQAILGFSEILLTRLTKDSAEHRNASEIQKAAKRAAEMTRHLLAFSRKQPIDKRRLDLNAAIRDTEVLLQLMLGDKSKCVLDLASSPHEVYADHSQITQILMNLAVNARDAMPEGGRLTIATEHTTFDPQTAASLPGAEPGTFICLSVTDTGCGISPEAKEHLFEPFFTTKDVGQGTGLGLAVVYGIVKQNKGWIHVYSEEGQGTTFKVYLPACDTDIQEKQAVRTNNGRILFVEDDAETRNMVIRILNASGYETVATGSAEDALELFRKQPDSFDLLFSDMTLPAKSGIDLADELRAKKPGLPVLLYSGYQDQRERWTRIEIKGYRFLQKPFAVTGLLAAVHDALAETIR